jgi:hypothetical protein
VTPLAAFLGSARRRLSRRRVLVWTARGAAVAAIATLAVQLGLRRWPALPVTRLTIASAGAGLLIAVEGWGWGRPSLAEVARLADLRLASGDRLSTAFELRDHDGFLVGRQRADAERWAQQADAGAVVSARRPHWAVAVAAASLALALIVGSLDNPAETRMKADQAAEAAREDAARKVDELAAAADRAAAPEPGGRAVVRELRQAAEALRRAPTRLAAAAALSRAEQRLAPLAAAAAARQDAAAAAGAQLSASPAGAAAGAAMAQGDRSAENGQMAAALGSLSPEEKQQTVEKLTQAAAAPGKDPEEAQQLAKAAEALGAGDLGTAAAAMASAQGGSGSEELDKLAASLPKLSAAQLAALAKALQQAAPAAGADPQLAEQLRRAADELATGKLDQAADALREAAASQAEAVRAERAGNQAGEAMNELDGLKKRVLDPDAAGTPSGCGTGATPSGPAMDHAGMDHSGMDHSGMDHSCSGQPQAGSSPEGGASQGAGGGPAPAAPAGGGAGPGAGQGQGAGGQSNSAGQGGGAGSGSGSGNAPREGGGGASGGGAHGFLQGPPGHPSEQVYAPGVFGAGRTLDVPGGGAGPGADPGLVPYEQVYAQYRSAALSQVDREQVPIQVRDLLRRYFEGSDR